LFPETSFFRMTFQERSNIEESISRIEAHRHQGRQKATVWTYNVFKFGSSWDHSRHTFSRHWEIDSGNRAILSEKRLWKSGVIILCSSCAATTSLP
jgi:hypothetical protein